MEQIKAAFIDKMGDDLRAANVARVFQYMENRV